MTRKEREELMTSVMKMVESNKELHELIENARNVPKNERKDMQQLRKELKEIRKVAEEYKNKWCKEKIDNLVRRISNMIMLDAYIADMCGNEEDVWSSIMLMAQTYCGEEPDDPVRQSVYRSSRDMYLDAIRKRKENAK